MLQVQISQETFSRLQGHAEPLVDTIETVINRALDALESDKASAIKQAKDSIDPAAPPSLSFTTVRTATVDGKKQAPNESFWNSVLLTSIRFAAAKGFSSQEIADFIIVNNVPGKKEDSGYKYVKEAGLSVQGQDANAAWKAIYHLAIKIGLAIDISFMWQNNPKAAFPGQTGKLSIS